MHGDLRVMPYFRKLLVLQHFLRPAF